MNQLTTTNTTEQALDEHIEQSLRGVGEMRIENMRMKRQLVEYEQDRDRLSATIEDQKRDLIERDKVVAQLRATCETLEATLRREAEERAFYHAYSIEITTHLNLINDLTGKAIAKAKEFAEDSEQQTHEAYAPGGNGGARVDLPRINPPSFIIQGNGQS